MAETLFKGFKQVRYDSGQTLENGYLYFVRTSEDKNDGYLYLNGKKYGTAEEVKKAILGNIGNRQPQTIAGVLGVIDHLSDIIGNGFSTGSTITQAVADLQSSVTTLSGQTHSHENATVLDGITADKVADWDSAVTDKHTHNNKALLDTYTQTEANLADAVSKKHSHKNATVLDGITAGKVAEWDNKVDKVDGKGLSTNDFTNELKTKLDSIATDAQVNVQADWNEKDENSDAFIKNKPANLVQDKDYVHTDNNYTTAEKNKLSGIEAGAQVNKIEAISVNGVDAKIEGKKATVTISEATTSKSGVMSAADKTKLDGIAAGAQVNYIKSVGDNLAVDGEGKLTVNIPSATVTGVKADDKVLSLDGTLLTSAISLSYDSTAKEIYLKGKGDTVISTVSAADFIKDGMIDNVAWSTGKTNTLVITFNTESGKEAIEVDFQKLVDTYTAGNGIDVDGQVVSVKINETANTASGVKLSADNSGLKAEIMIYDEDAD